MTNLPKALFTMRITIALFLLPWIIDKFTASGVAHTAGVFKRFYKIDALSQTGSYAVGIFWAVLLLAFVLGFQKRISYGLVMLAHGIGTIMTWDVLLPWMENHNMLFLASIPVLGSMIALYMMRDEDTLFTLDNRKS